MEPSSSSDVPILCPTPNSKVNGMGNERYAGEPLTPYYPTPEIPIIAVLSSIDPNTLQFPNRQVRQPENLQQEVLLVSMIT